MLHGVPAHPADAATLPLPATDAALLALVALDGPAPRGRLAAWLWPQASASAALGNLRQRLYRLQRRCGDNLVTSQGEQLSMDPRVQVLLAPGDTTEALAPDADFLGTHDYRHLPQINAWVEALRAQWRSKRRAQLQQAVATHRANGDLPAATSLMHQAVAAQPLDEDLARQLMQLQHAQGDRAALQHTYGQLTNTLRRELGVQPSAETAALHRQLLGTAPPAGRAHATPLSADAQDLLHLAAVVGTQFGVALAAQALDRPALRLIAPWQELQAAGWFGAGGPMDSPALQALRAALPPPIVAHLQALATAQACGAAPVPMGDSHSSHAGVTPGDTGPDYGQASASASHVNTPMQTHPSPPALPSRLQITSPRNRS
jgi:DNA-binding SARP family transcriptional activator